MSRLYNSPLRVYICLGFLALLGIYSGLKLPISLFPNSSKPSVTVMVSYGSITADEYLNTFGRKFESQLQSISANKTEIEKIEANYDPQNVRYHVEFKWGTDPREAMREVELVTNSFASQFPQEIRDTVQVWSWGDNVGFLAVSFFSHTRDLDDLYKYLDPILTPLISHVNDAADVDLWNPSNKEIQIELSPEKMAVLGLYPRDISDAVSTSLNGSGGGTITIGLNQLNISMPRQLHTVEEVGQVSVGTPSGKTVHLSDIAHIDFGVPRSNSKSIKTSGAQSLILFADPKPGGNIKRMAEEVLEIVKNITTAKNFPKDIQYKILVDPSEFIRSAISNVFREVVLAAFLAVCVLFLFIGNIKNVITAAIEIPMSIVLAFILMKFAGINLNLISLGGLALSAGMNVDASVVVMENIFRHFESVTGKLDFETRFHLVTTAVKEVRFPIIASTIASLVVFLPLAFTSGLSNALLGDLALAVVFSHGFSALVALVLVPTVRLHLMSAGASSKGHSPIEGLLKKLEHLYSQGLSWFIENRKVKIATYVALTVLLVALGIFVTPRLQKEIIGRPDTDWIMLNAYTDGNTLVRQMESQSEEIESRLLEKFGDKIQYTFTQTRSPNNTQIMARLSDKKLMTEMWHDMEKYFVNTPETKFNVSPWNPSELSIPDPPQLRVVIRGGDVKARSTVGQQLTDLLENHQSLTHISSNPGIYHREGIILKPHLEQWSLLEKQSARLGASDLADIARVATVGRKVGNLPLDNHLIPVMIQYPEDKLHSMTDLASFPIGVKGKLLPMKSLAEFRFAEVPPSLYRLNEQDITEITGKMSEEDKSEGTLKGKQAQALIEEWEKTNPPKDGITISFEDAEVDMNEALEQLERAVGLSVLLIFLTMVLQMGDVMNALIVLVAVPLGFIGVFASLYIFKSTLSLNSVLGVILLNGIAVANSIILVDFLRKLVERGLSPKNAALEAAQKRLRPILMTSMTTALGMMPVALGLGDGGRILQPLGIAVVGGLGFSLLTTLFVVPSLQVSYLQWKAERHPDIKKPWPPANVRDPKIVPEIGH